MNKSYCDIKPSLSSSEINFISKINDENEESKKDNVIYDNSISLLKHKVFLEKIMHLIKLSQMEYLSKVSSNQKDIKDIENKKDNNHDKIMIIKNILINLKKDLTITLFENTENKAIMQNLMNNNKSSLVKNLFGYEKENNGDTKTFGGKKKNLTKSVNYNVNSNFKSDDNIYNVELPHLKFMNFKITNQLEYMTALIKLKTQSLSRIYSPGCVVFCDNQNDINKVSEYLHDNLIIARNQFISIVQKKDIQNRSISLLTGKVNDLKEDIEILHKNRSNDYINTSEIIKEESRECYTKTNITTMENYKDDNKKNNKDYEDYSFMKKNIVRISDLK